MGFFTGSFALKGTSQTCQLLFYSVLGTMSFTTPRPKHTVSRSLWANKKRRSLQNVLVWQLEHKPYTNRIQFMADYFASDLQ
jgi:hypothetical protein